MTRTPTGRIESLEGRLVLSLERTFRAPIEDVWAAVTEPERLARWLGTWTGDPATGRVSFRMLFEGEAPAEDPADDPTGDPAGNMEIRECDPPRRLAVTSQVGEQRWFLDVDLTEADGVTTLSFSQPGVDPDDSLSIGPGWDYYFDRLVAVETGGDLSAIDFERDYYPAMAEYYRAQRDASTPGPRS